MNRKLQAPIIACTAAALALSAGLLFAGPGGQAEAAATDAAPALPAAAAKVPAQIQRAATTPDLDATEVPRPRARRARSGFALPYFSFARGAGARS